MCFAAGNACLILDDSDVPVPRLEGPFIEPIDPKVGSINIVKKGASQSFEPPLAVQFKVRGESLGKLGTGFLWFDLGDEPLAPGNNAGQVRLPSISLGTAPEDEPIHTITTREAASLHAVGCHTLTLTVWYPGTPPVDASTAGRDDGFNGDLVHPGPELGARTDSVTWWFLVTDVSGEIHFTGCPGLPRADDGGVGAVP